MRTTNTDSLRRGGGGVHVRWLAPAVIALMAGFLAFGLFTPPRAEAASYVVTIFDDIEQPTGCQQPHQGECTLRDAIKGANSGGAAAVITFNITGGAVPVISVGSTGLGPLPELTTRVTIDGTTQSAGYVRIRGTDAGDGADGFRLTAGDSTIRGLAIYGFSGDGIEISGPGGNTIEGNYIGTSDGTAGGSNRNGGHGVFVNGSPDNTIGPGNVLSNNGLPETPDPPNPPIAGTISDGVRIEGAGATGNVVAGNRIGTNAAGTSARGNTGAGVRIQDAPGNMIGGTTPADRNVISGNKASGVLITGAASTGNVVAGNHIGMNTPGGAPIPNSEHGVELRDAPSNTVGGTDEGARNVISGNAQAGVSITGAAAGGNIIRGNYMGPDANGMVAPGNTGDGVIISEATAVIVSSNLISGNAGDGVRLQSGNTAAIVTGNLIGTDKDGAVGRGNGGRGVWIDAASGNLIGYGAASAGNVISGNGGPGVEISAAAAGEHADDNYVVNNYIGLDGTGSAALGNDASGVLVTVSGPGATATGNRIGDAGAGNVISGNSGDGVTISGADADGNTIFGNRIGTDAGGSAGRGNGEAGVRIMDSASNVVSSNVISDNGAGVHISGAEASGNLLQGNLIGTGADGGSALGNRKDGVLLDGAPGNNIGGAVAVPGALAGATDAGGNVISGNGGNGVLIEGAGAAGNTVSRNHIGTNASGAQLGNAGHGVLTQDVPGADIGHAAGPGGTGDGAGNRIAYNGFDGVSVAGASNGVAVSENDIHSNGGLGIDLDPDGPTANDGGDSDTGANGLQNAPVLSLAENPGAHIVGALDSVIAAPFRIEFFSSSQCDPSGSGEGQHYLGTTTVTTDGTGTAAIEVNFAPHVYTGDAVTATATDVEGNTSEFSACVTVTGPVVPTPTPIGQTPTPTPTPTPVPTPTPTPAPPASGDVNCDGSVDTVDSLGILRHVAGLPPLAQQDPCTPISDPYGDHPFGDVNCDGGVDAVDSLYVLRHVAGLPPLALPSGCPAVGA